MTKYSCESIVVLTGLEPVRRRPGMYIGDTRGPGLHHMLWELVGNVIDQHLSGYAHELRVQLGPDGWISVRDDGAGIPTELIPQRDRPFLEEIFTQLHHGPTFDGHYPHVHVGGVQFGVGVCVVSALAERLEVETTYRGVRFAQAFERGIAATPLRRLGATSVEGTAIRFRPDPQIFARIALDAALVEERLTELAWLNPHLRVIWQERRIAARGGLLGWARQRARARGPITGVHAFMQARQDIHVEVALAWNADGPAELHSFVNMQPAVDGAHIDGLWDGFFAYARARKCPLRTVDHAREAAQTGLVAIVKVGMYAPRFGAPSRDHLTSPEAGRAVKAALLASLHAQHTHGWRVRRFLDERLLVPAAR